MSVSGFGLLCALLFRPIHVSPDAVSRLVMIGASYTYTERTMCVSVLPPPLGETDTEEPRDRVC